MYRNFRCPPKENHQYQNNELLLRIKIVFKFSLKVFKLNVLKLAVQQLLFQQSCSTSRK